MHIPFALTHTIDTYHIYYDMDLRMYITMVRPQIVLASIPFSITVQAMEVTSLATRQDMIDVDG